MSFLEQGLGVKCTRTSGFQPRQDGAASSAPLSPDTLVKPEGNRETSFSQGSRKPKTDELIPAMTGEIQRKVSGVKTLFLLKTTLCWRLYRVQRKREQTRTPEGTRRGWKHRGHPLTLHWTARAAPGGHPRHGGEDRHRENSASRGDSGGLRTAPETAPRAGRSPLWGAAAGTPALSGGSTAD